MKPLRILHVCGSLNRGGTETWLMNVLRRIDRRAYRMDFLLHARPRDRGSLDAGESQAAYAKSQAYGGEALALGSQLISLRAPGNAAAYWLNLASVLQGCGPFDIVHSHVEHFTGFVLAIARACGVRVRVAHSHSDLIRAERGAGRKRRAYTALMRASIRRNATHRLAASPQAAASLYGKDWRERGARVLPCGIAVEDFAAPFDGAVLRRSLGIGAGEIVIGHVGRFVEPKNQRFVIDLASALLARRGGLRFLFVGDGPLRPEVEAEARRRGLGRQVLFLGDRGDVPELLRGAMDIFVLPSVLEGLGLALVEAQAAGLTCVVSEAVPAEADVIPGLVQRLPIDRGAGMWADEMERLMSAGIEREGHALARVRESVYDIGRSVEALTRFYDEAVNRR